MGVDSYGAGVMPGEVGECCVVVYGGGVEADVVVAYELGVVEFGPWFAPRVAQEGLARMGVAGIGAVVVFDVAYAQECEW